MRNFLKYMYIYFGTALMLTGFLLAAATIPQNAIERNEITSAKFLTVDPDNYHYQIENVSASIRDQYADANLLNIAYYFSPDHPLDSIIWDYYYREEDLSANESLLVAVTENPPANTEYLRYWHGSLVIIRPLMVFFSIDQIYILHAIILIGLLTILIYLLLKNKCRVEAIALVIALFTVNVWFVPFCLEYYWMFLVMFLSSILTVKLVVAGKYKYLDYLFLVTGIVSAFLDFLTVEIITVLIPLLLALSIRRRKQDLLYPWKTTFNWLLLWGSGFVAMWALKWGLAAVYTGQDVGPYLKENMMYHLGLRNNLSKSEQILRGWLKNFFALLPFEYGIYGSIAVVLFIVFFVVIPVWKNKVKIRSKIDWKYVRLYFLIGILPYIRYMMLPEHASNHFFFMYRAQVVTIIACCFVVRELIEKNPEQGTYSV